MRCLSNQAFIASLVNLHEESIRIPFLMAYWNYINHALMATCGYLWPWPRTVLQCGVIGQHFAQPKELDSGDRGRSGAFQTRFDWSNLWRCEKLQATVMARKPMEKPCKGRLSSPLAFSSGRSTSRAMSRPRMLWKIASATWLEQNRWLAFFKQVARTSVFSKCFKQIISNHHITGLIRTFRHFAKALHPLCIVSVQSGSRLY